MRRSQPLLVEAGEVPVVLVEVVYYFFTGLVEGSSLNAHFLRERGPASGLDSGTGSVCAVSSSVPDRTSRRSM